MGIVTVPINNVSVVGGVKHIAVFPTQIQQALKDIDGVVLKAVSPGITMGFSEQRVNSIAIAVSP